MSAGKLVRSSTALSEGSVDNILRTELSIIYASSFAGLRISAASWLSQTQPSVHNCFGKGRAVFIGIYRGSGVHVSISAGGGALCLTAASSRLYLVSVRGNNVKCLVSRLDKLCITCALELLLVLM